MQNPGSYNNCRGFKEDRNRFKLCTSGQVNALDFVNIPVSILTGVLFGALVGWLLGQLFELLYRKGSYVRNSMKVIIIMGLSVLLMALETLLKGIVAFSGL